MDGTVYLDETWINGQKEFLSQGLEQTGRKVIAMTNNHRRTQRLMCGQVSFIEWGLISIPTKQLITSGHATIDYLKRNYPGKKIYLFGNKVLMEEFEAGGITFGRGTPGCRGFLHLTHLLTMQSCVRFRTEGSRISVYPDYNCPTKTGLFRHWIFACLCKCIHRTYAGQDCRKPNKEIIDYTLNVLEQNRRIRPLWEIVCVQT